jgi:alkyl hydroperoxide reductase subunit AhpC
VKKLKPDPQNARLHPERNKDLIRQSLEEVGAGRSILVDGDGIIRAGNGVYEQAQALGAEVWGVSGDDASSHQRFAGKHQLPYPLLVDTGNQLRRAYGVPSVLGLLPGRVTYVIDGEGVIRHVFNNLLDGPAHRREAIEALQALGTLGTSGG